VFSQCDDDTHSIINSIITDCIANHVPLVIRTSRSKVHSYSQHIQRQLEQKATAWHVYNLFVPLSYVNDICTSFQVATFLNTNISTYLAPQKKIINSPNINKFYGYANKNFTVMSTICPLKSPSGDCIIDPGSTAELLIRPLLIHSLLLTITALSCPNWFQMILASARVFSLLVLYVRALIVCRPNLKTAQTAFHLSSSNSFHCGCQPLSNVCQSFSMPA
jgi:hypothetical protein